MQLQESLVSQADVTLVWGKLAQKYSSGKNKTVTKASSRELKCTGGEVKSGEGGRVCHWFSPDVTPCISKQPWAWHLT